MSNVSKINGYAQSLKRFNRRYREQHNQMMQPIKGIKRKGNQTEQKVFKSRTIMSLFLNNLVVIDPFRINKTMKLNFTNSEYIQKKETVSDCTVKSWVFVGFDSVCFFYFFYKYMYKICHVSRGIEEWHTCYCEISIQPTIMRI